MTLSRYSRPHTIYHEHTTRPVTVHSPAVRNELSLLGVEAKALGRDFLVRLIKSGVRPSISGDLWSESGMGLFGIFAHGITETSGSWKRL